MSRLGLGLGLGLGIALFGCEAASPELGYDATLQVRGGQYRPGAFPAATGGPATPSVVAAHATISIGELREKLHGVLDPSAHAAILGITGTDGAWILPAGPPDIDAPSSATLDAVFGLAVGTEPGPFELVVAASDGAGRIGTATPVSLIAADQPPPDGQLVVGLDWQGAADLDLHVLDPLGNEAWSGSPNTWKPPPPGVPVDPNEYLSGGILDRDANAACARDGAPSEHVIWKTRTGSNGPVDPLIPPGTYTVRVDTSSLCGDASASWYVTVYVDGALLASARGDSVPDDTQHSHRAGAGVTALQFQQ